jgi:hypothetical protein
MYQNYYQEPICSPKGLDCYNIGIETDGNCLTSCEGLYADVFKDQEYKNVDDIKKFKPILRSYGEYKRGYSKDIGFPKLIESNL